MDPTEPKKYNYAGIPLRDQIALSPYRNKHDFISALPEMVKEHADDYAAYFLTVTFKNKRAAIAYEDYKEFFNFFRRKLDQKLLADLKQDSLKPKLIMFPESAPELHFHGLVLVHKHTHQKFMRKCVEKVEDEFIDKVQATRPCVHLKPALTNPYPEAVKLNALQGTFHVEKGRLFSTKGILTVHEYKMYPMLSDEDLSRATTYCSKSFLQSAFNDDQIILETKLSTKSHK